MIDIQLKDAVEKAGGLQSVVAESIIIIIDLPLLMITNYHY